MKVKEHLRTLKGTYIDGEHEGEETTLDELSDNFHVNNIYVNDDRPFRSSYNILRTEEKPDHVKSYLLYLTNKKGKNEVKEKGKNKGCKVLFEVS